MSVIVSEKKGIDKIVKQSFAALLHDSKANWTVINPTLPKGTLVYEDDDPNSPKFKLHDGVTAHNALPYTLPKISVGTQEPSSPAEGDLWIDTN